MAEQLLNAEEQAISSECPELEELLLADDQVAAWGLTITIFQRAVNPVMCILRL